MIEPMDSNIAKLIASRNTEKEKKEEKPESNKAIGVIHDSGNNGNIRLGKIMHCHIETDADDVVITLPDDGTRDHFEMRLVFPKKEVLKVLGALYTNK